MLRDDIRRDLDAQAQQLLRRVAAWRPGTEADLLAPASPRPEPAAIRAQPRQHSGQKPEPLSAREELAYGAAAEPGANEQDPASPLNSSKLQGSVTPADWDGSNQPAQGMAAAATRTRGGDSSVAGGTATSSSPRVCPVDLSFTEPQHAGSLLFSSMLLYVDPPPPQVVEASAATLVTSAVVQAAVGDAGAEALPLSAGASAPNHVAQAAKVAQQRLAAIRNLQEREQQAHASGAAGLPEEAELPAVALECLLLLFVVRRMPHMQLACQIPTSDSVLPLRVVLLELYGH